MPRAAAQMRSSAEPVGAARLLDRLAEAVGARHVLTAPDDLSAACRDWYGVQRGAALAVVRPASAAEVAAVVRLCAEASVAVVPQGGRTGLVGGGAATDAVALSLERLDRIRAVDVPNATMTVEAGCVLRTARAAAEEAGAFLPLALPSEGSCRIGGVLSTNAGGVNVLRYGNARELALGLEVVLPDGRLLNAMTGLRKDNTGYDLRNLFIGAEGTLGVVTAAVLKLFPAPRASATALVATGSAADALAFFAALRRDEGDALSAFEYLPHVALAMVLAHVRGAVRPFAEDHPAYALVELTSPRAGDDLGARLEAACASALEGGSIRDAAIARSGPQAAALWRLRDGLAEAQGPEGVSIKHDVSVSISRIPEFLERAEAACRAEWPGCRPFGFGHLGDGNVHFNVAQPPGAEAGAFRARAGRFNALVHDVVLSLAGSISAEHGIGLAKRAELARVKDPVALDLMRRLKATLDPRGIMNPGKVL